VLRTLQAVSKISRKKWLGKNQKSKFQVSAKFTGWAAIQLTETAKYLLSTLVHYLYSWVRELSSLHCDG